MAACRTPVLSSPVAVFFFFVFILPFSTCNQFGFPQNIETFYPFLAPAPAPAPFTGLGVETLPVRPIPALFDGGGISRVLVAILASIVSSLVVAGFAAVFLFLIARYLRRKREADCSGCGCSGRPGSQFVVTRNEFERLDANLLELVVDRIGSSRNSEDENRNGGILNWERRRTAEPIQRIPLLRGKSTNSHLKNQSEEDEKSVEITTALPPPHFPRITITAQNPSIQPPKPLPPPPPVPPPPIQNKKTAVNAPPPPPPPIPRKKIAPPPPPPKKLKPLHWDKVKRADHSMVWDKIEDGSFRFDADLMERLFGSASTNSKSPKSNDDPNPRKGRNHGKFPNPSNSAQITLLDPRKSQNTAIILKSMAVSRRELLDALTEGQGLETDMLEKLMRIAPTAEQQSEILDFSGDLSRLADAESFLYHLLKAVPSAFKRVSTMLFRSNYDCEILQVKEYLQTLEAACKELRTCGLFMKLLEAILKAGNRMNAGTARGDAEAFKLTALRKLSDVKSTDGKTTLLHFVVEEVVGFEGKRCVLKRNRSLNSSSSSSLSSEQDSGSKEERAREYIMLGLPLVRGLSAEFSNVKKAAVIDFDAFYGICSSLTARAADMRIVVFECSADGEDRFVREMQGFLDAAEEEIQAVKEEQKKVMEVVRRTTEYYQPGASYDQGAKPLQLFVIVTDFLGMVDLACVEIARNLQNKRPSASRYLSQLPKSKSRPVRFANLPAHFLRERSGSSPSESDSD